MASYTIPGGPFHPNILQTTIQFTWNTVRQLELTSSQRKYLLELARTRNAYWLGPDSDSRQAQMERLVTSKYESTTQTFTYMTRVEARTLIFRLAQMKWDSRVPKTKKINRPAPDKDVTLDLDKIRAKLEKVAKWGTLNTTNLQLPAVGTIVLDNKGSPIGVVTGTGMTERGMVVNLKLNDSGSSASLPWSQPASSSDLSTDEQPDT